MKVHNYFLRALYLNPSTQQNTFLCAADLVHTVGECISRVCTTVVLDYSVAVSWL